MNGRTAAIVATCAAALTGCGAGVTQPDPTEETRTMVKTRREGDRVWVAGVPRPRGVNSVLASTASVLQAAGEDVTYEHLMGVSSRAFRLQFNWCPSAPHSYCGFNTFKPALQAVGYTARSFPGGGWKDQKQAEIEKGRAAVRAAIEAGRPCLSGSEEEGVLVGFEPAAKGATGWLARPGPIGGPPKANEPYLRPVKKLPWGVCVLTKSKEAPPPRRESVLWSLKAAVANAGKRTIGDYSAGFAAWERWIAELADLDPVVKATAKALAEQKRPHAEKDVLFNLALGNAWCFESVIDARQAAAKYLRSVAGEFDAEAGGHLRQAAGRYEKLAEGLTKACPTEVAPYPWMLKDIRTEWTDDMRRAQADLLKTALTSERKAVAAIGKAVAAMDVEAAAKGKTLSGLKQRPAWMTHMGCLMGCAKYLKVDASPAWIYGGSGHAFAMNVHEAVCPSGPTAWCAEKCDALAANVGLVVESHRTDKMKADFAKARETVWERTKKAIDAGTPCFGWEMDVPEWYVVTGYDADGNYLFDKFGGAGRVHHAKLGGSDIGVVVINAVKAGKPADDRTVVREALAFAVAHGAGKNSNEKWRTGLSGYDAWINALSDAEAVAADKVIGFGTAYNAQCWAECRRHAVAFLTEAKTRLADKKLDPLLDQAVARYAAVSRDLAAVAKTFPFDVGKGKEMAARIQDAARRAKAVEALKTARAAEAEGLKVLAKLVKALES